MTKLSDDSIWLEYYEAFSYFVPDNVRPLCHPRKFLHSHRSDKAIVLIHGLTDSPYSQSAIALYLHIQLGYDVYLPLLQGHGLKDANGMRGVRLSAWKENVRFAVEAASQGGRRVSIGGLSTGGALAFHFAATDPKVEGELYLFSGAFGLYGGKCNLLAPLIEGFLKLPFIPLCTSDHSLIAENPYRYSRVPLIGARELVYLIDENKLLLQKIKKGQAFENRVFSVWSEVDRVVRIDLLAEFDSLVKAGHFVSYVIPRKADVIHACVVLAEAVYASDCSLGDPSIEPANPYFYSMMDSLFRFESSGEI